MKVYVGTYAKYNNGSIAGAWLDLEDYTDLEGFYDDARALHSDEADPELMFQDWEGPDALLSESSVHPSTWEVLELDEHAQKVVIHLVEYTGYDVATAIEKHEDVSIIHCDYEHEAGTAYFDYLMETYSNSKLPFPECYVDKVALFRNDGNTYNFVDGIGLIDTSGI